MEIAVFRHINRGDPTHYVTIAEKYIPPHWTHLTITVVHPETWKKGKPLYGHLAKKLGAKIYRSYKIVINKPLLEQLGLLGYTKPVWIRITEYNPNPPPPPPKPYIQKPTTIHCDGSSYFIVVSANTVNLLREITPGRNLRVTVYLDRKPVTYVKRPAILKTKKTKSQMYKVLLPTSIFGDTLKSGMLVPVRIETTDEPETIW